MAAALNRINEWTRLPPAQLWAEVSRVLPPWVALVIVILIGWQIAKTVWLLFPATPTAALPPVEPVARTTTSSAGSTVSIERIVNAHLFGRLDAAAPALVEEQEDAPDTQLSLELRGTITASVEQDALAIIAERGGDERVYSVGDAVPGGASLHAVHFDRVLLRRGGRLEALRLPRSEDTAARRTAPRASAPRPAPQPARVASVQDVIQQSAASLTEIIRPQPVFKDGRQQGYRVYPGRQRAQFAQLGLRPGDLITQINGMALDDPARGMEIFRGLADATSVTVTVDRNGETEMLTLNTATLQQSLQVPDNENPTE
ncbi:MAG TPA: type II secretion system protein GspC [Gammaproteobacteria bacterium]|nr:type II secretion system protein GspC [Gammaproteobacteria bacterium]